MFAQLLAERFKQLVMIVPMDMYYKDQSALPLRERLEKNMDNPEAFDISLLVEHLHQLVLGREISQPIYDFSTHSRVKNTRVGSRPVIIVEGLLAFALKQLRDLYDLRIYLTVDDDVRLARRILRDLEEKRSKTLEGAIGQYLSSARPMHRVFVEPQKDFADIIIPWENETQEAIETVSARIFTFLYAVRQTSTLHGC
jgi:uridine kinase